LKLMKLSRFQNDVERNFLTESIPYFMFYESALIKWRGDYVRLVRLPRGFRKMRSILRFLSGNR
jgi:hypothetical protein